MERRKSYNRDLERKGQAKGQGRILVSMILTFPYSPPRAEGLLKNSKEKKTVTNN